MSDEDALKTQPAKTWTINFALAQNLHARVLPPIEVGCHDGVVVMPPVMTTWQRIAMLWTDFAQRRECARSRAGRYHLLALAVAFVVQL